MDSPISREKVVTEIRRAANCCRTKAEREAVNAVAERIAALPPSPAQGEGELREALEKIAALPIQYLTEGGTYVDEDAVRIATAALLTIKPEGR